MISVIKWSQGLPSADGMYLIRTADGNLTISRYYTALRQFTHLAPCDVQMWCSLKKVKFIKFPEKQS